MDMNKDYLKILLDLKRKGYTEEEAKEFIVSLEECSE